MFFSDIEIIFFFRDDDGCARLYFFLFFFITNITSHKCVHDLYDDGSVHFEHTILVRSLNLIAYLDGLWLIAFFFVAIYFFSYFFFYNPIIL